MREPNPTLHSKQIKSPCIKVCSLNSESICIGCFRSIDEISNWSKLTNEEKSVILKNIDQKRGKSYVKDNFKI